MDPLTPYVAALLLGSIHALEADHMAAVTAFAVRRPAPLSAAVFGIRWAVGHGASVLVAGALLMLAGLALPAAATFWLDKSVGLVLIGLGAWTMRSAGRLRAHTHATLPGAPHVHLHAASTGGHEHRHAPTMIGALHGLAGAAPAIALLQISAAGSFVRGLSALLVFAVGTALGMACYALFAGLLVGRMARASEQVGRALGRLTGVGTIAVGILWLLR